eukprot:8318220-Alexandrium_andersonii.AAC.1
MQKREDFTPPAPPGPVLAGTESHGLERLQTSGAPKCGVLHGLLPTWTARLRNPDVVTHRLTPSS